MTISRLTPIFLLSLAMVGCQKPAPKSPIDDLVKQFETERKQGLSDYGVSTIQSSKQNISTVDCMVFEEAAKQPIPTSLGRLSSYVEAMKLRAMAGCNKPQETVTQYESSRRALKTLWLAQQENVPSTTEILLKQSQMGKLVANQSQNVTTEETACQANEGVIKRQKGSRASVDTLQRECQKTNAASKTSDQCYNAWVVAYAHQTATGQRDDLSQLSELVSRYHMAYLTCSPSALPEYVQYHNTVPRELFAGPAYRLSVPVDPILQCQIQEVKRRMDKNAPYHPDRQWMDCAGKYKLVAMYTGETIPEVISTDMITGKDTKWLFDPTKAKDDPKLWNFNQCEQEAIALVRSYGLNLNSPQAIKRYCSRRTKRQN